MIKSFQNVQRILRFQKEEQIFEDVNKNSKNKFGIFLILETILSQHFSAKTKKKHSVKILFLYETNKPKKL